jgi:hypothetical protein
LPAVSEGNSFWPEPFIEKGLFPLPVPHLPSSLPELVLLYLLPLPLATAGHNIIPRGDLNLFNPRGTTEVVPENPALN